MTSGSGEGVALVDGRIDSMFARVLGRQPTDRDRIEVYRLRDALGLDDNDAVFGILLAFQNFRWLFDEHPSRIEAAARVAMADVASGAAAVATAEVSKIRSELTAAVADAAKAVARSQMEVARWRAGWMAAAGLSVFGGLLLVCGFELGRGRLPPWMRLGVATADAGWLKVIAAILGAPAGWLAVTLALPVLASVVMPLWDRARAAATVKERRGAGLKLAGAVVCWLVAAVCVAQLVAVWR